MKSDIEDEEVEAPRFNSASRATVTEIYEEQSFSDEGPGPYGSFIISFINLSLFSRKFFF